MTAAEDQLWCLRQGGRPLERFVGEFLELSNRVSWHDAALGACFQLGLDETTIHCDLPTCDFPLIELINLVLYLNGSELEVEEVMDLPHPAPPENNRASPAHPTPGSSTYPANGFDHTNPPSTIPVLQSKACRPLQSQARRPLQWLALGWQQLSPSHQPKEEECKGRDCGLQPLSPLLCQL